LAQPAIKAVEAGETKFVPETWAKTYFEWMRNIQPWCVSRQLWWGHRIPAWYGPEVDKDGCLVDDLCNKAFVAHSVAEALEEARRHYGPSVRIEVSDDGEGYSAEGKERKLTRAVLMQDEDVLDTWFSSALWPFSTQGWPEKDPTAEGFYPGTVLVTAFDIISFSPS